MRGRALVAHRRVCAPGSAMRAARMTRLRASDVTVARPTGVAEGAVVSVFRVPPEAPGQRLDVFVQSQLHRTSRTRAQAIVRASAFDAAGRRLKPNDRVRPNSMILLWRPPWDETPVAIDVPVLYEDEHLLAVDKPALLPVHPTARYHKNTLIKMLEQMRPDVAFLSLGHRLDRETSGVMLVSKSRACDRALKRLLQDRSGVEKTYVAHHAGRARSGRRGALVRLRAHDGDRPGQPSEGQDACRRRTGVRSTRRRDRRRRGAPVRRRTGTYARVECGSRDGPAAPDSGAPRIARRAGGRRQALWSGRRRASPGRPTANSRTTTRTARARPRHALHAHRIALPHPMTGAPFGVERPAP